MPNNYVLFVDSLYRNHTNLISASENIFGEKKFQKLYARHTLGMWLKNSKNWIDKPKTLWERHFQKICFDFPLFYNNKKKSLTI